MYVRRKWKADRSDPLNTVLKERQMNEKKLI